jgi:hypothetical protein
LRGSGASRPTTNARARRRGSTLRKRARSAASAHRACPASWKGSALWPAATARLSCVVTTHDHRAVTVLRPAVPQQVRQRCGSAGVSR